MDYSKRNTGGGIILPIGTFTILHWPGSRTGVLWLITTAASMFMFIPFYFFTGIRNPETKVNTIVSTILLVVVTGLAFYAGKSPANRPWH